MKLCWTPLAVADRNSIFDFIASDNVAAAVSLDELFQKKAALLAEHPVAGRTGRVRGTRELVAHRHYVLVYDVSDGRVRILRVLHTSLQYPSRKHPAGVRRSK
ncbi:MAG: type II toxin-antitoxin system RelE/ParE family toxin [Gammaproteobacteria bacterium]|nr:MAG: type II toxin-antitoxin system RelE/ParE family toxin [Gammaproteobacteria bacterium]